MYKRLINYLFLCNTLFFVAACQKPEEEDVQTAEAAEAEAVAEAEAEAVAVAEAWRYASENPEEAEELLAKEEAAMQERIRERKRKEATDAASFQEVIRVFQLAATATTGSDSATTNAAPEQAAAETNEVAPEPAAAAETNEVAPEPAAAAETNEVAPEPATTEQAATTTASDPVTTTEQDQRQQENNNNKKKKEEERALAARAAEMRALAATETEPQKEAHQE